jgi:hypothetical protein
VGRPRRDPLALARVGAQLRPRPGAVLADWCSSLTIGLRVGSSQVSCERLQPMSPRLAQRTVQPSLRDAPAKQSLSGWSLSGASVLMHWALWRHALVRDVDSSEAPTVARVATKKAESRGVNHTDLAPSRERKDGGTDR